MRFLPQGLASQYIAAGTQKREVDYLEYR